MTGPTSSLSSGWPDLLRASLDARALEATPDDRGALQVAEQGQVLVLASASVLTRPGLADGLQALWALLDHRRAQPWVQFFDESLIGSPVPSRMLPRAPEATQAPERASLVVQPAIRAMGQRLRGQPFQVIVVARTAATMDRPFPAFRDGPAVRSDLVLVPGRIPAALDETRRCSPGWHVHSVDDLRRQVERLDLVRTLRAHDGPGLATPRGRPRL